MASPLEVIVKGGRNLHLLKSHQEGDPLSRGGESRGSRGFQASPFLLLLLFSLLSLSPSLPFSLWKRGGVLLLKGPYAPPIGIST